MGTRAKNYYVSDFLKEREGNYSTIIITQIHGVSEIREYSAHIQILINEEIEGEIPEFSFIAIESTNDRMSEFNELMDKRYVSKEKTFDEETMNTRLRDVQYQFRLFAEKAYENEMNDLKSNVEGIGSVEDIDHLPEPFNEPVDFKSVEHIEVNGAELVLVEPAPSKVKASISKVNLKAPEAPRRLGLDAMIYDTVKEAVESEEARESITSIMNDFLNKHGIVPNQTHLIVNRSDVNKSVNVGAQHKTFPQVLKSLGAGVNIALVGPAGSGKTTAVENSAKALELPFYSKSVSAQTGVHEFFGYQDANGNYVSTLFRQAYEHGGVFLLDEYDNGNPNVLASMNQATSNGYCAFADKMVEKHKDFLIVMAGNTYGHGATTEYIGRNKIDAATLDRFVFIQFGYDELFELQLSNNKDWAKKVQAYRARAEQKKVRTVISPRATFDGDKLFKAGFNEQEVLEMTIFKGLTTDEINLLKS